MDFAELLRAAKRAIGVGPMRKLGAAVHSLRAVTGDEVGAAVARIDELLPGCPIHIHLAEQRGEVEQSVAKRGRASLGMLAASTAVDERWTLVHATQCNPSELADIGRVGATVG